MIDVQQLHSLVDTYKNFYLQIRNSSEWSEKYKWENLPLIHEEVFSENSSLTSLEAKIQYLNKSKQNRVNFMGNLGDLETLVKEAPQELGVLRQSMFKNKENLADAIDTFRERVLKIIPKAKPGSAMFGYLFAAYDPNTYPLYKDGIFLWLRQELDKDEEWKGFSIGKKYEVFTEICNEIGAYLADELNYDSVDNKQLSALDGQDFLYIIANSFVSTLVRFIKQSSTTDLKTKNYPKEYMGLDLKVSFGMGTPSYVPWIGFLIEGQKPQKGIYPVLLYFKEDDLLVLAYGISATESPDNVRGDLVKDKQTVEDYFQQHLGKGSRNYGGSYISTVYKVSKIDQQYMEIGDNLELLIEQYKGLLQGKSSVSPRYRLLSPGQKAIYRDYFQRDGIIGIGWNELGDLNQYDTKHAIAHELKQINNAKSSQSNNANACWEFVHTMQVGDIVIAKKGATSYIGWGVVTGDYEYHGDYDIYHHTRKIDWIRTGDRKEMGDNIVVKTLTDITKYPDYVNSLKQLLGIQQDLPLTDNITMTSTPHALNQILYGVPGTGKTYATVNYAVAVIEGKSVEEVVAEPRDTVLERYRMYKDEGQIVFTTFHQSFGYENFIEGLKPDTNEKGDIIYDVEDGIFKRIAVRANDNVQKSNIQTLDQDVEYIKQLINEFAIHIQSKLEDGEYQLKDNVLLAQVNFGKDGEFKSFNTGGTVNNQSLTRNIILRDYIKLKQGLIHSYKDIKPTYESKMPYHGNALYYYQLLEKIHQFEKDNQELILTQNIKEVEKNYVLIIDEINRGNISKIFGELITLLEPDKRLGNTEARQLTLPYSKQSFGVPSNLYLIGTMNTADRSIALMDIALRRRFHFVELTPNSQKVSEQVDGIDIKRMFEVMNQRITMLYDKDHQIGHAYLMKIQNKSDLDEVFLQKIIPLLQEYFYDDREKIQIVLGDHIEQKLKSGKDTFIHQEKMKTQNVIGFGYENMEDDYTYVYNVNKTPSIASYKGIYQSTLATGEVNEEN